MREYVQVPLMSDGAAGPVGLMCKSCGALVEDQKIHDRWHSDLEGDIAGAGGEAEEAVALHVNGWH